MGEVCVGESGIGTWCGALTPALLLSSKLSRARHEPGPCHMFPAFLAEEHPKD